MGKAPPPTERQVQRSILQMMGTAFPSVLVHHSPNGGHLAGDKIARFMQVGALKGDGMKIGWPDLTCVWNHGIAFMEVKRPGYTPSQVSSQQREIHAQLAEMGFAPAIVTTSAEAFSFLRERGAPCRIQGWREAA
jgi:hypothetical protein